MRINKLHGPACRGVLGALLVLTATAAAASDPGQLCDIAARDAALAHQIPTDILMAITRVETGRTRDGVLSPWPWAINYGGKGTWYDDRAAAVTAGQAAADQGVQNFDIGCFQLNWRWHGAAFASVDDMFDPARNADYAARFLSDLYAETGDWAEAVATYHSRSDEPAERYLARVEEVLQSWSGQAPVVAVADEARVNRFPLLQAGGAGAGGSIVPLVMAEGRFIDPTPAASLMP